MDLLGGLISGIAGIYGASAQAIQAEKQLSWDKEVQKRNWDSQLEQQTYNRGLQQTMFQREDNAVQRRASDLERAGFNRLLAAGGSGASSGPVVKSEAPIMERVKHPDYAGAAVDSLKNVIELMRQKEDIARSFSDRKLIDAQVSKVDAEKLEILLRADAQRMQNTYWSKAGMVPNASNVLKEAGGIWKVGNDVFEFIKNKVEDSKKFQVEHQEMPYDFQSPGVDERFKYIK